MLTALLTRAVSAVVEKVRAAIIREKQSRIAQQYTLPSRAGCSVISVHHSSLGLEAVNRRLTRSTGVSTLIRLGFLRPGRGSPYRPCSDMMELTSLWLTFMS
jgi:hypothetical protein